MKKNKKIVLISIIVLLIDQITKLIVKNKISSGTIIKVIGNFFRLTYLENSGAAWSILEGKTIFLIIISFVFLFYVINCIKKDKRDTKINILSYSFIIGGIIGNMIDRIIYHRVIDFLSFKIFSYYFPVFNIADSLIVIGVILFIIDTILEGKDEGPMALKYKKIREKMNEEVSSK